MCHHSIVTMEICFHEQKEDETMNRPRRKSLRDISVQLEALRASLEVLQEEEEEYLDNMPENFRESERYKVAEEANSHLEDAVSFLEDVIDCIEAATEYGSTRPE